LVLFVCLFCVLCFELTYVITSCFFSSYVLVLLFLIKEVIMVVAIGDGGGYNRNIHLSISCYNVASIKRQVFIIPHHLDLCMSCCVRCHRDVIDPSLRHALLLVVMMFLIMVLTLFCFLSL